MTCRLRLPVPVHHRATAPSHRPSGLSEQFAGGCGGCPPGRGAARLWRWLLTLGFAAAASWPTGSPAAALPTPAVIAPAPIHPETAQPTPDPTAGARAGGRWGWPLAGRPPVLRAFDPPATPYGPGHRGVDLGAAPGDLVLAAGSGVVAFAGVLAGRGVVSVQHTGGRRTTYEPLTIATRVGATVSRGTVLGRVVAGHAGCPRPACVHWGLRRGENYLDPLSLLRRGAVRLLPLHPTGTGG